MIEMTTKTVLRRQANIEAFNHQFAVQDSLHSAIIETRYRLNYMQNSEWNANMYNVRKEALAIAFFSMVLKAQWIIMLGKQIYTYQGIYVTLGQTFTYTFMSGKTYVAERHVIVTDCDGKQYDAKLAHVYNETKQEYLDGNETITLKSNAQNKSDASKFDIQTISATVQLAEDIAVSLKEIQDSSNYSIKYNHQLIIELERAGISMLTSYPLAKRRNYNPLRNTPIDYFKM